MEKVSVAKKRLVFVFFFFFLGGREKDAFSDFQISQTATIHASSVKALRWRSRCTGAVSLQSSTVAMFPTRQSKKRQYDRFLILIFSFFFFWRMKKKPFFSQKVLTAAA